MQHPGPELEEPTWSSVPKDDSYLGQDYGENSMAIPVALVSGDRSVMLGSLYRVASQGSRSAKWDKSMLQQLRFLNIHEYQVRDPATNLQLTLIITTIHG
jgi:hypothetical protein